MKFAVTISVALALALAYAAYDRTATSAGTTYQERYAYWQEEFEDDPDSAYAKLVTHGKSLSYDASHELAHMAGEIIFGSEGLQGIARCTADFEFGCYHGFAGRALSESGLGRVQEINAACTESSDALGCLHGIGHGVLAFLGNGKLAEALDVCASLGQESPVGGCYGGVFMEYNFNTMQSDVGIAVRPFEEEAAHEPCSSLPEKFRIPCFFDQAAWWHAAATDGSRDEEERFHGVGLRCAKLVPSFQTACYQGVGNVIGPTSGYDTTVMREWCDAMPAGGREPCFLFAKGHVKPGL